MEYLERGWDDARIAKRMQTTPAAVQLARKRYGIPCRRRTVLTAREVARRLGLGCAKTVTRWIEQGHLHGHRGWKQGATWAYALREAAVLRFLRTPAFWHLYDVDYIVDPGWKSYARKCRGGVRLFRVSEAADVACVQGGTLNQWIRKGWLPARKRGANWFIRSDDLVVVMERRERTGSAAIEPAVLVPRDRLGTVAGREVAA